MGHQCNGGAGRALNTLSTIIAISIVVSAIVAVAAADSLSDKGSRIGLGVNHHHHPKDVDYQLQRRFQRSPKPTSVCDGLCNCTKEKEIFLNVVCDFTQNKEYILDEQNTVPDKVRQFHVNLGPNAQLLMRGRLFRRINRISIDGGRAGGRQQIDFGPRAFHDNTAPFPEINLRHAQTLNIHGNAFQGDFKLNVANVDNVIVQANAFQNTSFIGHFTHVKNLRFEKDAFLGTRNSQIQILDSYVGLLERMDASMHEIKLQNCRIDAIRAHTFDVVSIKSIILDNCDIDVIEANFTTGKLLSEYLGIVGCRIGTIKSKAIANSGFSSVEISRNKIENIESEAISANAINLTFEHNEVTKTGAQWLTVREWSAVGLTNNSFGHFDSIDVLGSGKACRFSRNSITQWTQGSLATMGGACRFQDNVFSTDCTCSLEWLDELSPHKEDLRESSYCQVNNAMQHCFNASTFNAHKFNQMVCGESMKLDCRQTMAEKKVEPNFLDPNDLGRKAKQYEKYLYLLAGIVCLVVLVLLIILVFRMRCQGKPPRNTSTSTGQVTMNRQTTLPMTHGNTTLGKAVKSFSGHDRAIVDLALEKLRVKHPREVFDQVDTYTRKLMTEHLSETEKVLTIGEIVRLLDELESIGDDFLAFTDLLYRHLDESNGQTSEAADNMTAGGDPLYAEPGLMGAQPTTTVIPTRRMESDNHIYAEPNSAQQPLLKTEYSLPMDRSVQGTELYADPVLTQNDKSARLVSPYAIGNQLPCAPPVVSNLPDVLSRSVAGSAATVGAKAVSPPRLPAPKLNTFGKSHATSSPVVGPEPGTSRGGLPMYSIPLKPAAGGSGSSRRQQQPLQRDNSSSSSCNSNSNHSGGSDITFKIDDIVDYVDS